MVTLGVIRTVSDLAISLTSVLSLVCNFRGDSNQGCRQPTQGSMRNYESTRKTGTGICSVQGAFKSMIWVPSLWEKNKFHCCAALGDMLEAEDFIYDDEEDEEGEYACIDTCGSHGGAPAHSGRSGSSGKHRLMDAVDGARSAAEVQAALREQGRCRNKNSCMMAADNVQVLHSSGLLGPWNRSGSI